MSNKRKKIQYKIQNNTKNLEANSSSSIKNVEKLKLWIWKTKALLNLKINQQHIDKDFYMLRTHIMQNVV